MLSFFPRDVLDEILNLIESVSEGFPSYSFIYFGHIETKLNAKGEEVFFCVQLQSSVTYRSWPDTHGCFIKVFPRYIYSPLETVYLVLTWKLSLTQQVIIFLCSLIRKIKVTATFASLLSTGLPHMHL